MNPAILQQVKNATPEQLSRLRESLTPRLNRYIPFKPHPKQSAFLLLNDKKEVLFGGAAGGSKSCSLMMAALQYADCPDYHALMLRRTFPQLAKPGGLIPMSKEWLAPFKSEGVEWRETDKVWRFPSGATLTFGHLQLPNDIYNYQGANFSGIFFDELTQFTEEQYRYLFSRLRRKQGSTVPIRMRSASNPGGVGMNWVKRRFLVEGPAAGRVFLPSKLEDNPSLDREAYIESLSQLDTVTKAQLLAGSWEAYEGGRFFSAWFEKNRYVVRGNKFYIPGKDPMNCEDCWRFVIVDPAASEKSAADYTVITTFGVTPERGLLVLDVVRDHFLVDRIIPEIAKVCQKFTPSWVGVEATHFQRLIAKDAQKHEGIPAVRALMPDGHKDKLARAVPAIIRCEAGQVHLPESAPWLEEFLGELLLFTGCNDLDSYSDQTDTLGYAVAELDRMGMYAPPVVREVPRQVGYERGRFGSKLFGGGG